MSWLTWFIKETFNYLFIKLSLFPAFWKSFDIWRNFRRANAWKPEWRDGVLRFEWYQTCLVELVCTRFFNVCMVCDVSLDLIAHWLWINKNYNFAKSKIKTIQERSAWYTNAIRDRKISTARKKISLQSPISQ